ncbi:olfactory receptor 8S1-like [Manis javanica]|uniref:olfactory receptor 8S1-like n=1 Tax=Manis javanica TaxID=9974 RepID=UPI003C6D8EFE
MPTVEDPSIFEHKEEVLKQAVLFGLFLQIYLLMMTGNLTLLLVVRADSRLHTPMCLFLSHLSFLDLCLCSVIVPKMENLLSEVKTISVRGCPAQGFFAFITAGTLVCLLSVMACDRCAAIGHPLLYGQVMRKQLCVQLVWGSCVLGFLNALINTLLAANLDFCENHTISHCSSISYVRIAFTILSISSTSGRSKAFSTCFSHLTAYSVVTPMLNPLIYSLENKKVKAAVRRTLGKHLSCSQ